MQAALRYAIMMKRLGKPLTEYDGVGFGAMAYAGQRRGRSGEATLAKGSISTCSR
jgi:hypothetical protein